MTPDFPAVRELAAGSVIAHGGRRVVEAVRAALLTSWVRARISDGVRAFRRAPRPQRMRVALFTIAIAAATRLVLLLPAPAYAQSAWPWWTPLAVALGAAAAAIAITRIPRT